jgi:hypothetical protein
MALFTSDALQVAYRSILCKDIGEQLQFRGIGMTILNSTFYIWLKIKPYRPYAFTEK